MLAAFLIALEYVDHGIQKRLEAITGMESELPDDPLMPEIELPEIDIEELRLAAQERRSQLPLHKLKESWQTVMLPMITVRLPKKLRKRRPPRKRPPNP